MADNEQVTRHEREIGELRGKLDSLATKDFVRQVVQEQTQQLNKKIEEMRLHIDSRIDEMRLHNDSKIDEMRAHTDKKIDDMRAHNDRKIDDVRAHYDQKFDQMFAELRALNDKQHRITGAADFLKSALPMLISVVTLIVLIVSLLAGKG
ncbi:MAG: hypothetical protein F4X02_03505 [Chloroflexi bacterium]|nr:hypothetical protein [Chloroflexota bacterium]